MQEEKEFNIVYTSHSRWQKLKGVDELLNHLSYMKKQYDFGCFCNLQATKEWGACSITLEDESFPILRVTKITEIPLLSSRQKHLMQELEYELIDFDEDTENPILDEESITLHSLDHTTKTNIGMHEMFIKLFTQWQNVFCRIYDIEILFVSRDAENKVKRDYSHGKITLSRGFDGTLFSHTDLDLHALLINGNK